jgi:CRISPR-associated protein Cmr6
MATAGSVGSGTRRGTVVRFNTANKTGSIKPDSPPTDEVGFHLAALPEGDRAPEPKPGDRVEFVADGPRTNKKGKRIQGSAIGVTILERAASAPPAGSRGEREDRGTARPLPVPNESRSGDPVARWIPLYHPLGQDGHLSRAKPPSAHTGLLFDKFCDVWAGPGRKPWAPEAPRRGGSAWYRFLGEIGRHLAANKSAGDLVKLRIARRRALVAALGGDSNAFFTDWRFVSGLGLGHPLETGFVWHRTLAVPYLPGSSVKGLVRAWAERWSVTDADEVARLFGPRGRDATPGAGGSEADDVQRSAGSLVVFDALPVTAPALEVDVMNPHYAPYYVGKGAPGDYHPPRPLFFLTVSPGQLFDFAIAPRPGAYDPSGAAGRADVERALTLLSGALETLGAGGKTAVGYGRFRPAPKEKE